MNAGIEVTRRATTGPDELNVDAGGTIWRLRSLVAMGDAGRIARALRVSTKAIQKLLRGETADVSTQLRDLVRALWNVWWDKRAPERTGTEYRLASAARRQAQRMNWCPPLGLDEDELDEPGYRPYSRYRHATGTGVAADFPALCTGAWAVHSAVPKFAGPPQHLPSSPRLSVADQLRSIRWTP
jgi:hypothetical protein